jgi:hypothetical protein|tara:strand:+ start:29 stop:154 length:126 start_codon:yes stop_codon:yes gene_type:complete
MTPTNPAHIVAAFYLAGIVFLAIWAVVETIVVWNSKKGHRR